MKNNFKYKDTVFRHVFKDEKNFVQLYESLSGKTLKPSEIEFYDTKSLFIKKELQNDVSFLTKDNKFIILIEHQSTISFNMALRLLIYYVELLKIFIDLNGLNIFGTKPIKIPSADFYVVYNGDYNIEDMIQKLEDNFECDLGQVKVTVTIKNINYGEIKTKKSKKNNFIGYCFFIDQIKKYKKLGLRLEECFERAKKDCIDNGYLIDYLNKKEFLPMALQVYTIEQEMIDKKNDGYEEGIEEGIELGLEKGIGLGIEKGIEEGITHMVNKLLRFNMSLEDISKISELSIEQLLKIKEQIDK